MKLKLAPFCLMALVPFSVFACSSAAKPVSVDVSCDDFSRQPAISREAEVPVGASLTVTLCSNPSTGFKWKPPAVADQATLQQVDHKFVGPEANLPGSASKEVWTFKALQKGKSTVSIDYSRPWAGGEKGTWKFTLTVVVR